MTLKKLVFRLLLVFAAISIATSEIDRYDVLLIDSGASQATSFNDSDSYTYQWLTDDKFTKSGENFTFTSGENLSFPMNSLRFFPTGSHSCYDLPCYRISKKKFLFRVGFFYGNYDGLSRPPQFDLTIDGNFWTRVETSLSDKPVYYELIYRTKEPGARLCLERTEKDIVPFVSSIEVFAMASDILYKFMDNHTALILHSRINFGANETIEKNIGHYEEAHGRIWKSMNKAEYLNIQASIIPDGSLFQENLPPWSVLATAIQANSNSNSIDLPINFDSRSSSNNSTGYFVLYFKDPIFRMPNKTSSVDIFINHNMRISSLDIPSWIATEDYRVITLLYLIPANRSAIVTISPANATEVAPLLNAMEVFSVLNVSKANLLVTPILNLLLVIVYWLCNIMAH